MAGSRKLESIQVLRGILFIGIAAFHCNIGIQGAWCTSVFFVLSGFILAYRYFDYADMKTDGSFRLIFALNHIKNLYLLHIAMLLVSLSMSAVSSGDSFVSFMGFCYNNIEKLIPNILLIQSWYPTENYYFSFNGVSWYLSTALFCYYMFPLVFSRIKKHSNRICRIIVIIILAEILLSAAGSIITVRFLSEDIFGKWLAYISPPYRLLDFMLGICTGLLYCSREHTQKRSFYSAAEISVLFLTAAEIILYKISEGSLLLESFRCSLLFITASMLLIYLFAVKQGLISNIITCRPLIFIGNISGCGFIIHLMVICCVAHFTGNLNKVFLFAAAFLVTVCLSCFYLKWLNILRSRNFFLHR